MAEVGNLFWKTYFIYFLPKWSTFQKQWTWSSCKKLRTEWSFECSTFQNLFQTVRNSKFPGWLHLQRHDWLHPASTSSCAPGLVIIKMYCSFLYCGFKPVVEDTKQINVNNRQDSGDELVHCLVYFCEYKEFRWLISWPHGIYIAILLHCQAMSVAKRVSEEYGCRLGSELNRLKGHLPHPQEVWMHKSRFALGEGFPSKTRDEIWKFGTSLRKCDSHGWTVTLDPCKVRVERYRLCTMAMYRREVLHTDCSHFVTWGQEVGYAIRFEDRRNPTDIQLLHSSVLSSIQIE